MDLTRTITVYSGAILEILGIIIITAIALYSVFLSLTHLYRKNLNRQTLYTNFRHRLGQGILLGLEFLVAGDIIRSVVIQPTFRSVGVLAAIVLIRTFLSFTLEIEMTGKWPWKGGTEEKLPKPKEPAV